MVAEASSGSSVRPSRLVVTALSRVGLPSRLQSSMRMPAAGRPVVRSRTWVLSLPGMEEGLDRINRMDRMVFGPSDNPLRSNFVHSVSVFQNILQTEPGDFLDFRECGGVFGGRGIRQPGLHGGEDGGLG